MSITVRRLVAGDATELAKLVSAFGDAFEEPDVYTGTTAVYAERVLASGTTIILAAYDGAQIVGGISAYELRKIEQQRSEVYLYDLGVVETHRRQGVATALIEELRSIARTLGASTIFVQADEDDDAAIALYSKFAHEHIVAHHFDIRP